MERWWMESHSEGRFHFFRTYFHFHPSRQLPVTYGTIDGRDFSVSEKKLLTFLRNEKRNKRVKVECMRPFFACGFTFVATVLLLICFAERELLQHFPANT